MANTPKYLLKKAGSIDLLRSFHLKTTDADKRRAGLEEEFFVYAQNREGLLLASPMDNIRLERFIAEKFPDIVKADAISLEPGAHMIETKTDAFSLYDQAGLVKQIVDRRTKFLAAMTSLELIRSPYSSLPTHTPQQALNNMICRIESDPERGERQITIMEVFRQVAKEGAHYPVYSVGEQFTHGCRDADELLDVKRLVYALAPMIYNLFDNSPPFIGGERQYHHPVIALRSKLKGSGLLDRTVFEAQSGADYADRKVQEIIRRTLYLTHDKSGHLVPTIMGENETFKSAFERGDASTLLYLLAQLQSWPFQKDKLFNSNRAGFYGIGNEIRDLGNGPAMPAMAATLFTPIVFDAEFREKLTDILVTEYGVPLRGDPQKSYEILRDNLDATLNRIMVSTGDESGLFLNAPIGNRGKSQLQFLRDHLVPMLAEYHSGTALEHYMAPLAHIARTGMTDTQFFYRTQHTAQDCADFMNPRNGYDPRAIFGQSTKSFAMLDEEGLLPARNKQYRSSTPSAPKPSPN